MSRINNPDYFFDDIPLFVFCVARAVTHRR
jgi:hypothetical protein